MKAKGMSLLLLHRQKLIYTGCSTTTLFLSKLLGSSDVFERRTVSCYLLVPFIYSVYTNITLQSAMQALHCVRQKKIGRHRATMSGWHGTPAIACQEGLLGHNIITKEELHAHNTFNGNQVISNMSNSHENSLVRAW